MGEVGEFIRGRRFTKDDVVPDGIGSIHYGEIYTHYGIYADKVLSHVLVMAALAICAVTAAQLRDRTDTQAAPPATPGQAPPPDPGMIPLTVPEIKRLLAATLQPPHPRGHDAHWLNWRRRHQARSRWFHQRARLNRDYALVS
jgi:hypothetical protein